MAIYLMLLESLGLVGEGRGRDGREGRGGEENMDYKQIGLGKVSCMRCCKEFCGGGSEQCFFLEANLIICREYIQKPRGSIFGFFCPPPPPELFCLYK